MILFWSKKKLKRFINEEIKWHEKYHPHNESEFMYVPRYDGKSAMKIKKNTMLLDLLKYLRLEYTDVPSSKTEIGLKKRS